MQSQTSATRPLGVQIVLEALAGCAAGIVCGAALGFVAARLFAGGSLPLYVLGFGALCIAMQVFFSYENTVRILKWLTLALFAYVAVILTVRVPWRAQRCRLPRNTSCGPRR